MIDLLVVCGTVFLLMLPYLWPFGMAAIHIYREGGWFFQQTEEECSDHPHPIMRIDP